MLLTFHRLFWLVHSLSSSKVRISIGNAETTWVKTLDETKKLQSAGLRSSRWAGIQAIMEEAGCAAAWCWRTKSFGIWFSWRELCRDQRTEELRNQGRNGRFRECRRCVRP